MGDEERRLLLEAFDSNWIAPLGPFVDRFEREIAARTGVRDAAALSSGTAAIHLAFILLGISRGDRVLCSTFTFAATANPIVHLGAEPVFIDSDETSWNMNPDLLEEELRRGGAKAVIVTDLYGQCADYDRINTICAEHGVPLIEDAAEALGATYRGRPAGSLAPIGILSFNGNKIITTSGGGMLLSNDVELVKRARFLSTQARDPAPHYEHSVAGFNYRMSNLLAAVGVGQLHSLDEKLLKRRKINEWYRQRLRNVRFMPVAGYGTPNYWLTCVVFEDRSPESVRVALERENIEARPLWKPMHLQPLFAGCRVAGGSVSAALFEHGLALPSGSAMTERDVERVCSLVDS
jgi:dTDP-4-amino-4,6-dideoxygalactose transaminase